MRRVGAIVEINNQERTVLFAGYGEVTGEQYPPEDLFSKDLVREYRDKDWKVLKIKMDGSGEILYGCEIWWLDELKAHTFLYQIRQKGWNIINVEPKRIVELRQRITTDRDAGQPV